MSDNSEDPQPVDPGLVRYLRALVTALSVTMIVGFIVLIAVLVTRLRAPSAPTLPEMITLPDGAEAAAFTMAGDWYAVVTRDQRILIYDRATGALRQTVEVTQ